MMTLRTGRSKGVTLIELLLSLVIVTGTLVFILGGLATVSRFLTHADLRIQAMSLAEARLATWSEALRQGQQDLAETSSGADGTEAKLKWQIQVSEMEDETLPAPGLLNWQMEISRPHDSRPLVRVQSSGWQKPADDNVVPAF